MKTFLIILGIVLLALGVLCVMCSMASSKTTHWLEEHGKE